MLLAGFSFRQIFIVVLFTLKDFSTTVFMVREKAMSYQTHNYTTEIKEAIHTILTFSLYSDNWIVYRSCSGSGS